MCACLDDGDQTLVLPEVRRPAPIDNIVPTELQEKISQYMPIYRGNTPPNVEGSYLAHIMTAVYCSDYGHGGYAPGHTFADLYFRFQNQNNSHNTLDYEEQQGTSFASGKGALISGEGNNFTACFNTAGESDGIPTKTALVISGTKTSQGIKDFKYAFVFLEKGNDPNDILMAEGEFRIFKDGDDLAANAEWPQPEERNVVPEDIAAKIRDYMPIYTGNTPPDITGQYNISPVIQHCSMGLYTQPTRVDGEIVLILSNFINTQPGISLGSEGGWGMDKDLSYLTSSTTDGNASIAGNDNHFTVYYTSEEFHYYHVNNEAIYVGIAWIISGTKVENGIQDLHYAFVITNKFQEDPQILDQGEFRVFTDADIITPKY